MDHTLNIEKRFRNTFEPGLIKEIKANAEFLSVPAGGVILDIGQNIRLMPIILSGSVKISRVDDEGKEILLYYVNPNESCAMTFTCCMQQIDSKVKAVAEEDVELLALPIDLMDQWMGKYHTWKNFVMGTIQSRFDELLQAIDQIAFQQLDKRLETYLREKSKVTGSSLINLSHEQIANDLASSRVVISRLLKKLENDQRVLLYRNQIKLLKNF